VLTAAEMVGALRLQAHPEGGWYRETWRSETALPNGRAAATSILFLLEADQRSHWHRVDAEELWIYQSGSPLALSVAVADGRIKKGDLVLLEAMGGGFTWGAVLVRW